MKVLIERKPSTDEGTFGTLTIPEKNLQWVSLELPWRDNQPIISCIPPGTYNAGIYESPRHGTVYILEDVPGRADVEIHIANFAGDKDKGYKSDLLGCITVGLAEGVLDANGQKQKAVLNSGLAFKQFMSATNGRDLEITIV